MKNKTNNAVFLQRLLAYIIDFAIVTIMAFLISLPFINSNSIEKIDSEINNIAEKLVAKEIDIRTYYVETASLTYESARQQGVTLLISVTLEILYFIVFQFYNSGQTIGKKLLKIKIVSNDGELSMNSLIIRCLFINMILLQMIQLVLISFVKVPINYLYIEGSFELIQYSLLIVTILMIMFSKERKGLHDLLTNSKVVKI